MNPKPRWTVFELGQTMLAILLMMFHVACRISAFQFAHNPTIVVQWKASRPSYQSKLFDKKAFPFITKDATLSPQRSLYSSDGMRTSLDMMVSPFDDSVMIYKELLDSNPFSTKLITGGILAVCGDAIAQSREPGDYDQIRAASFATFDMIYRAVQCAIFPMIILRWHGQYLTEFLPWMDLKSCAAIEDTMVNQFLVIPLIYYPFFFALTGTLQGLSPEIIIDRAKTTVGKLLIRNWAFWLPVQYIQFQYIDEPLQIPFLCLVGLAWTFILSFSAGKMKKVDEVSS